MTASIDRSGAWPAVALNDAAVAGKEPAYPSTVCATLSATLSQNAKGLLDDAVDANTANSKPDASRIQAAIDSCSSGAVKLVTGSGGQNAFLTGPITLKSNVVLWVDAGVTVFASRNPADYQISGKNNCGENASSDNGCNALITASSTAGSGVMGEGIIDGRGGAVLTNGAYAGKLTWWDVGALTKTMSTNQNNPRLIQVKGGSNFTVYKITLQNAPKFHLVPSDVDTVTVWGIKVQTPTLAYSVPGYACNAADMPTVSGTPNTTRASTCFTPDTTKNTDAVDPGQSKNVLIAFNHISTGDDGIAIKAHTTLVSQNIQILHNRFYFTHGMSIGSETDTGVNGVTVRDLAIDGNDANFAVGIRIKTDDSRGGEVKNVTYDGVCIRRAQEALTLDTYYGDAYGKTVYPNIHDITIRNVHYVDMTGSIYNGSSVWLTLRGYNASYPLNAVTLDNVVFDSTPSWKTTSLATPIPSFATVTMGPGPVSFASLLLGKSGSNSFSVVDSRSGSAAAYDCSNAFVAFPSSRSPI
ncbi:MAG: glycosyl hydrolase family 28 protein [Rhodocyclaceae bacterium]